MTSDGNVAAPTRILPVINCPVARFDGDTPMTEGAAIPTQKLSAKIMDQGFNLVYNTGDSTP